MTIISAKEILGINDNYVFIYNDAIIDSKYNKSDLKINNLVFNFINNIDLKLIFVVDEETSIDIKYLINKDLNISLTEIYLNISSILNINKNINVLDNANLDYFTFLSSKKDTKINQTTQTNISNNAYININNLSIILGEITSVDNTYLNEKHGNVDCKNVEINASGLLQDYKYIVHHEVGNTTSNMINYAICKGSSNTNLLTNGIIKEKASKSEVHQKTKGLILDSTSVISASPILEIDEYDVIASHGAGVGSIDEEDIFYLMSRGLKKEMAEDLIIEGLIYPVLNNIKEEKIKEFVSFKIKEQI